MTFFNNIVGPLPFQNLRWLDGVLLFNLTLTSLCAFFFLAFLVIVCDTLRFFEFHMLGNSVWEKINVA